MNDPHDVLSDTLARQIRAHHADLFGAEDSAELRAALEIHTLAMGALRRTDALYHNVNHTVLVTLVALELLRCRQLEAPHHTASDWLHLLASALLHDIGYVRILCPEDRLDVVCTGVADGRASLPDGATDAALQPWHVDRGCRFALDRLAAIPGVDAARVAHNIAYTRFPVPDEPAWRETTTERALVRGADLIGQLGDPQYLSKAPALFHELFENGLARRLGYLNPDDMRRRYSTFFAEQVAPLIPHAEALLQRTPEGRAWVASMHAQVVSAGRAGRASGPVSLPGAPPCRRAVRA